MRCPSPSPPLPRLLADRTLPHLRPPFRYVFDTTSASADKVKVIEEYEASSKGGVIAGGASFSPSSFSIERTLQDRKLTVRVV